MRLLDLSDDALAQILTALVAPDDECCPMGEGCIKCTKRMVTEHLEVLQAVRATCARLCDLVDGDAMQPYWEAMCKAFWFFRQQPWNKVYLECARETIPPAIAQGPCTECGLSTTGNERRPWKEVFDSARALLCCTPFELCSPKVGGRNHRLLLSVYMLLHRAVALVRTIGWEDGTPLILSVLGWCLVRANHLRLTGGPYHFAKVKEVLTLLSGLVPEALWPELSKARCRYSPETSVAQERAATREHQRLNEIVQMSWSGDRDIFDAVLELPGLMRLGYDVSRDPLILEVVANCDTDEDEDKASQYPSGGSGEDWIFAFSRVDELMTPNYGVELMPFRPETLALMDQRDMPLQCYLTFAIACYDNNRLERYLRHIPRAEDVASALFMAIAEEFPEHVASIMDSPHFDLDDVVARLGPESLMLLTAESGNDETLQVVAERLNVADAYDEVNNENEPFMVVVARRMNPDTVRRLLPSQAADPVALGRFAYLFEVAAETSNQELFRVLCDAGVFVPADYEPVTGAVDDEETLAYLLQTNLGVHAAARFDGLRESVWGIGTVGGRA